jgi:hypothetical protein
MTGSKGAAKVNPVGTPSSAIHSTPPLAVRTAAFIKLGHVLRSFAEGDPWPGHGSGLTEAEYIGFDTAIRSARARNGWYTEENVRHAALGISHMLQESAITEWLAKYPQLGSTLSRTVGIIMAGNIPFVGFHDLLCVLISGHRVIVKSASDDAGLTPALLGLLAYCSPDLAAQVRLTPGKLGKVDAVIATGSDNTARYFEHYFGQLPRIVRRSRTSVAVLDGTETDTELAALGEDVFRYFGLGCRNVGKVFIPRDFNLDGLFGALFPWKEVINHNKYANNYDYNKAVWLLDRVPLIENGFLILKEDNALSSPVASLYYERYDDRSAVEARLKEDEQRLQCIMGHGHLPFGEGQFPGPGDYADKVDTLAFLLHMG